MNCLMLNHVMTDAPSAATHALRRLRLRPALAAVALLGAFAASAAAMTSHAGWPRTSIW